MRIAAFTVCVNYDREIAAGIDAWSSSLDEWTVVTHPDDLATLALCAQHGVRTFATDAFYRDPRARFDKFLALSEAIAAHPPSDWILLIDADVSPPSDWRAIVERASARPGTLYGARRSVNGAKYPDAELAGYFQLWHASDPAWTSDPTLGSWVSCGSGDSALMLRWPRPAKQVVLPLTLTHHGEPAENWCGVGRDAERAEMLRARKVAGWQAERLDR